MTPLFASQYGTPHAYERHHRTAISCFRFNCKTARCLDGDSRLSVCAAKPCRDKINFDLSAAALESAAAELGMPISLTGCHGPCKEAPVLSLRIAGRSEFFAEVASAHDWQTIQAFAKQARVAGTLMTNAGSAERFRFDPVRDHSEPHVDLTPLRFFSAISAATANTP